MALASITYRRSNLYTCCILWFLHPGPLLELCLSLQNSVTPIQDTRVGTSSQVREAVSSHMHRNASPPSVCYTLHGYSCSSALLFCTNIFHCTTHYLGRNTKAFASTGASKYGSERLPPFIPTRIYPTVEIHRSLLSEFCGFAASTYVFIHT